MRGPIIKATSQLKTSIKHHSTVHLCSQRLYLHILQQFFECKPGETMWKFFVVYNYSVLNMKQPNMAALLHPQALPRWKNKKLSPHISYQALLNRKWLSAYIWFHDILTWLCDWKICLWRDMQLEKLQVWLVRCQLSTILS